MRVLLVEDEATAARMLAKGLREHAYAVDVAATGEQALYLASISDYDALVLDVMLPKLDGMQVCRRLRTGGSEVPILMLTARDAVEERIDGLDCGADDYLTKPFDFGELLARLRAVIRRGPRPLAPSTINIGALQIDRRARCVSRDDRLLVLTAREYALLEYLVLHADQVVGRAEIAEHVWDASYEGMSNVIDVCIQRLRRKIDTPGQSSLILTRRGEGYMLSSPDASSRRA